MNWRNVDNRPDEPGWYPTLTCWDTSEGWLPGAHYWNGSWFTEDPVAMWWPEKFRAKETARAEAYERDPGW